VYCLKSRLTYNERVFSCTYSLVNIIVQSFFSKSGASKLTSSRTASKTVRSRLAPMLSSSFSSTETFAISSIAPKSKAMFTYSVLRSSTLCCSKLCSVLVKMCLKSDKESGSILALIGIRPCSSMASSVGFVFSNAPAPTKSIFLVLILIF